MRYTNNVLEFDKNGKRHAVNFDFKADAFIYDSFNAFKIINGLREPMTDDEKANVDQFIADYVVVIPFSEIKIKKQIQAKEERKRLEEAGIEINGMNIDTSRDSQAMINGALTYLTNNVGVTINWKTNGSFVQLGLVEIQAIANAVAQHVQFAFNKEYEWTQAIEACTTEEELNSLVISAREFLIKNKVPGELPTSPETPAV